MTTKPKGSNVPVPPDYLSADASAWWATVLATYELDDHHLRLLTNACESWDRAQAARAQIDREGMTVLSRLGEVKVHPLIAVERDHRGLFARLVRELRLDEDVPAPSRLPRSRGRH